MALDDAAGGALSALGRYPSLQRLLRAVLAAWPEHARFLEASIGVHREGDLDDLDALAADVLRLAADNLEGHCAAYRWMCDAFLEEALHFARTGRYRCESFAQAQREVYDDVTFMRAYMRGALLSQVLWANHAAAALFFLRRFLPALPDGCRYLEVGPGHGLFLARAACDPRLGPLTAWDVSAESLEKTRRALASLGGTRPVALQARDAAHTGHGASEAFEAIVVSEVLEHLDAPDDVLAALASRLAPGGRMFVNVPLNSPAPDHVFLLESANQAEALVMAAGLRIVDRAAFPMTGYTLERAVRDRATISCVFVAQAQTEMPSTSLRVQRNLARGVDRPDV